MPVKKQSDGSELRRRAEERLRAKETHERPLPRNPEETERLLHELQVHRIELEMQNEELLRARQELEVSSARYLDLYDFSPAGVLTLNESGRILEANLTVCHQLGLERSRVVSASFPRFVAPPDRDVLRRHLDQVLETEEPRSCEVRLLAAGGGELHAMLRSISVPHSDGNSAVRTSVTDISERKRSEQALRDSEARFRLLSETATRLSAAEDPQGIAKDLCGKVMAHLDCQAFFNFLVDERAGRLHLNAYAGIPEEEAGRIEWLDHGVAVRGRVAAEDTLPTPGAELVEAYGIRAFACHPMMAQDRLLGTLSFGTSTRAHFSPGDLALMKTVTNQMAVAMERARLMGELEKSRDELEVRVRSRTAQLVEANRSLEAEIVERINAEKTLGEKNEQLRASEARLQQIIDILPVYVYARDRDGRFILANRMTAEVFGRPPCEVEGKTHAQLAPDIPESTEYLRDDREVIETGRLKFIPEETVTLGPGRVQILQTTKVPFVVAGAAPAVLGVSVDITERKRTEEALRQSEELLRTVLNLLPVGVWISDRAGKLLKANLAAEKLWGGARYVGLEEYGEYKGWWADTGKPIESGEWAMARAITRGEISINEMVDIQSFDGTRKTILNSALPIYNDNREIVGGIAVNQDITELRQVESALRRSEERLRKNLELLQKIVDGISDPLIMLDDEGSVKLVNKAAVEYYGLAESVEVLGMPCFQGLRGRDTACPECSYPFPSAGREAVTFQRKGLHDTRKAESITVYPVVDESGRRDAVVVKISDVTQARILERQILHNEKLASLGMMSSGIAHEINNPNTFIYFNIPILRRYMQELVPIVDEYAALHPDFELFHMSYGELREDIFRLLDNMEHGSQRINKIVGLLKSFVRKRDSEGSQEFDLKQLIDKVVALCHAEMRRTVKTFELVVPEDLPPVVSDSEALEQVLLNLLINAIHACDKQDSLIRVQVEQGCAGGDGITIEITDNGSGIDETVLDRIFDPFFTTKSSTMGTGLGLYICHNNMATLGGSIEVKSILGQGSTFRVLIPSADQK